MAKKKELECTLQSSRLKSIYIQNFRCIGTVGVQIDLDDIVVLVGPNNAGKSSILRAYEVVMSHGSRDGKLQLDDFPERIPVPEALPTVIIETIIGKESDSKPSEKWLIEQGGEVIVKEKWTWQKENVEPNRIGWNAISNSWDDLEQVPWGAPNVAKSKRPSPHRVNAFDSPDDQANEISKILTEFIDAAVSDIIENDEKETYENVVDGIDKIKMAVLEASTDKIIELEDGMNSILGQIFPGYNVKLTPQDSKQIDSRSFYASKHSVNIGPEDGYKAPLLYQGSGARRTLLWSALKVVSERNCTDDRVHVLLLDEPEICLHPSAIREACRIMYNLPLNSSWQVMVTTHSPCFIDLSRDNTTIVRVSRDEVGKVEGTTIFRPSEAKLDEDDRENLKLLNMCDPHFTEFFFGGQTIIVEGDTEYTAFSVIKSLFYDEYRNIHVVRARGKATIISLMKILNSFNSKYSVLHDADTRKCIRNGKMVANGAWTTNHNIAERITSNSRVAVSHTNFEVAFFNGNLSGSKPYNALKQLRSAPEAINSVRKILDFLCWRSEELPDRTYRIRSVADLDALPE